MERNSVAETEGQRQRDGESQRECLRDRQPESRKDRMKVKESEKDPKRKKARETQRARGETESHREYKQNRVNRDSAETHRHRGKCAQRPTA